MKKYKAEVKETSIQLLAHTYYLCAANKTEAYNHVIKTFNYPYEVYITESRNGNSKICLSCYASEKKHLPFIQAGKRPNTNKSVYHPDIKNF